MEIDAPKLSEILPPSLTQDKKILAAAQYLDEELKKLSGAIKQVLHLPRLDELSSDVLDHLAWQYHVDGYSDGFSEEIKRKMIRESIYLHRIKGTKAAVLLALSAFSNSPEISEWFDYEGKPYFFKAILHDLKDVGDDGEAFMRAIYDAKNVRSWLEEITFDYTLEGIDTRLYFAGIEEQGGEDVVELYGDEETSGRLNHSAIELQGGEVFVDLDLPSESIEQKVFAGIAEVESGLEIVEADIEGIIDEDEEYPDSDFLKLYFGFPNNSLRTLTLKEPRKNIQSLEIKLLGKFSADKKILMNRKGFITDGIRRALLIKTETEVIL